MGVGVGEGGYILGDWKGGSASILGQFRFANSDDSTAANSSNCITKSSALLFFYFATIYVCALGHVEYIF